VISRVREVRDNDDSTVLASWRSRTHRQRPARMSGRARFAEVKSAAGSSASLFYTNAGRRGDAGITWSAAADDAAFGSRLACDARSAGMGSWHSPAKAVSSPPHSQGSVLAVARCAEAGAGSACSGLGTIPGKMCRTTRASMRAVGRNGRKIPRDTGLHLIARIRLRGLGGGPLAIVRNPLIALGAHDI